MLILRADAADLLSCRFAISPLWELGSAVRITHRDPEQQWHEDWLAAVRGLPRPVGLTVLQAMQPARGYSPDFLAPPPADPGTTFAGELDRVTRTPVDRVLDELLRCRTDHRDAAACAVLDRLIADPVAARAEIVRRCGRAGTTCSLRTGRDCSECWTATSPTAPAGWPITA